MNDRIVVEIGLTFSRPLGTCRIIINQQVIYYNKNRYFKLSTIKISFITQCIYLQTLMYLYGNKFQTISRI